MSGCAIWRLHVGWSKIVGSTSCPWTTFYSKATITTTIITTTTTVTGGEKMLGLTRIQTQGLRNTVPALYLWATEPHADLPHNISPNTSYLYIYICLWDRPVYCTIIIITIIIIIIIMDYSISSNSNFLSCITFQVILLYSENALTHFWRYRCWTQQFSVIYIHGLKRIRTVCWMAISLN